MHMMLCSNCSASNTTGVTPVTSFLFKNQSKLNGESIRAQVDSSSEKSTPTGYQKLKNGLNKLRPDTKQIWSFGCVD
jgi:hypothetical protein